MTCVKFSNILYLRYVYKTFYGVSNNVGILVICMNRGVTDFFYIHQKSMNIIHVKSMYNFYIINTKIPKSYKIFKREKLFY